MYGALLIGMILRERKQLGQAIQYMLALYVFYHA